MPAEVNRLTAQNKKLTRNLEFLKQRTTRADPVLMLRLISAQRPKRRIKRSVMTPGIN